MFDFMHFLGFMAFNDAMEENNSHDYYSDSSNEPLPFGGILALTFFLFAAIIGMAYESWGWFFIVAVIGAVLGIAHHIFIDKRY